MNLLIAVPVKANLTESLYDRLMVTIAELHLANPDATLALHRDIDRMLLAGSGSELKWQRSMALTDARNTLLAEWLKPEHTHVLWIDADIVQYPVDLPARLAEAGGDGNCDLWRIPGADHLQGLHVAGTEYPNRVLGWFDRWFSGEAQDAVEPAPPSRVWLVPASLPGLRRALE